MIYHIFIKHSNFYNMKCNDWEEEKDSKQSLQPAKQVLVAEKFDYNHTGTLVCRTKTMDSATQIEEHKTRWSLVVLFLGFYRSLLLVQE